MNVVLFPGNVAFPGNNVFPTDSLSFFHGSQAGGSIFANLSGTVRPKLMFS